MCFFLNRICRTTIQTFATGLVAVMMTNAQAQQDELFSSLRGTSVFDTVTATTTSGTSAASRVTSIDDVASLLRTAGFETTTLDGRLVSTSKEQDPWTFPVLVEISDDERHLIVSLGLAVVKDAKEVPAATWIGMLTANQKHPSIQFAYNPDRTRTEVICQIPNAGVDGLTLRDKINQLAILARDTDSVWKLESPKSSPASESPDSSLTNPAPPAVEPDSASLSSLTGRWSAARSASEAFAAEFKADGSFVLVHVSQGKQTRTTGSFSVRGTTLTLSGDGLTLSGSFLSKGDDAFDFTPANTNAAINFKRAK
ncbi:MAG: hypothetical protein R3C20_10995 [Planctomycetaceae bacterium]